MRRCCGLVPLAGLALAAWDYARAGVLPEHTRGTARGLEGTAHCATLREALELGGEAGERAFFEHLWQVARRGPGEKQALRALIDRHRRRS